MFVLSDTLSSGIMKQSFSVLIKTYLSNPSKEKFHDEVVKKSFM